MRSFLGLTAYFHKHILNYAQVVKPPHKMLQVGKKQPLIWDDICIAAFAQIKSEIEQCPLLHFLKEDAPIYLNTDASDYGVGAHMFQIFCREVYRSTTDSKDNALLARTHTAYFHKHILNYAEVTRPLHKMLKVGKKQPSIWDDICIAAFAQIKSAIEQCPLLHVLREDAPIYLNTDASDYDVGAHMFQIFCRVELVR